MTHLSRSQETGGHHCHMRRLLDLREDDLAAQLLKRVQNVLGLSDENLDDRLELAWIHVSG